MKYDRSVMLVTNFCKDRRKGKALGFISLPRDDSE